MIQPAFSRTALLVGEAGVQRLQRVSVAVFGVGGVGSYVVEALARAGVGRIAVIDDDVVTLSNINRQLIALHSTVGRAKVEVARERILDINPDCVVEARPLFYSAQNADEFDVATYEYIVDAIDTVSAKLLLIERATAASTPIISSMGAGNKLDPTRFEVADIYDTKICPLARVMRRELKKREIAALKVVYSQEEVLTPEKEDMGADDATKQAHPKRQTPGSISFVPAAAGLIIAGEVVRDLLRWRKDEEYEKK